MISVKCTEIIEIICGLRSPPPVPNTFVNVRGIFL
jgi:hypothetical protein